MGVGAAAIASAVIGAGASVYASYEQNKAMEEAEERQRKLE